MKPTESEHQQSKITMKEFFIFILIISALVALLHSCTCETCGGTGEIDCEGCKNNYCVSCNGSGKHSSNCSTCGGDGSYATAIECPYCDGEGGYHKAYTGWVDCTACVGGSYIITNKECDDCSYYDRLCSTCDGSGKRNTGDYHSYCGNDGKVPCWKCADN